MPIVVAAREKTLDLAAYNNPTGDLLDGPVAIPAQAAAKETAPATA
ncbi:hypothetical protein [Kitasatospora aureofaciens]|nr:hypothetical protein [Kitasatospora aureofaciens]